MSTEAMRAALEALTCEESHAQPNIMRAVAQTILRDALAQRADEPVADECLRLANALDPLTRKGLDNLTCAVAAKLLRSIAAPAAPTVKESLPVAPAAPAYVPLSDLNFVHSVLGDVLVDIADWEDRALADAVGEARTRIESHVVARMRGEGK